MSMHYCKYCHLDKSINDFYADSRYEAGVSNMCKGCRSSYYKNEELLKLKSKEFRKNNPELVKKYNADYRKNNLEKKLAYDRAYYQSNKEKFTYSRDSYNNRIKSDPLFYLKKSLRQRIYVVFKRKGFLKMDKSEILLGATFQEVKSQIENSFTAGMTWSNYGEWHIDHIIPLASAKNEEELIKLFHYKNLQALWATENISKGAKINYRKAA